MSCEETVHHQVQITLKLPSDLLLKRLPCQFGLDQFYNIMIQRVIII